MSNEKQPKDSAAIAALASDGLDMIRNDYEMQERRERIAGRFEAEETLSYLVSRLEAFQENLPSDHELGIRLANYGIAETIHIRSVSARNPNLIEFSGLLPGGDQVTLVQHVSQLNFLLLALPPIPEEKPYRIGFEVKSK